MRFCDWVLLSATVAGVVSTSVRASDMEDMDVFEYTQSRLQAERKDLVADVQDARKLTADAKTEQKTLDAKAKLLDRLMKGSSYSDFNDDSDVSKMLAQKDPANKDGKTYLQELMGDGTTEGKASIAVGALVYNFHLEHKDGKSTLKCDLDANPAGFKGQIDQSVIDALGGDDGVKDFIRNELSKEVSTKSVTFDDPKKPEDLVSRVQSFNRTHLMGKADSTLRGGVASAGGLKDQIAFDANEKKNSVAEIAVKQAVAAKLLAKPAGDQGACDVITSAVKWDSLTLRAKQQCEDKSPQKTEAAKAEKDTVEKVDNSAANNAALEVMKKTSQVQQMCLARYQQQMQQIMSPGVLDNLNGVMDGLIQSGYTGSKCFSDYMATSRKVADLRSGALATSSADLQSQDPQVRARAQAAANAVQAKNFQKTAEDIQYETDLMNEPSGVRAMRIAKGFDKGLAGSDDLKKEKKSLEFQQSQIAKAMAMVETTFGRNNAGVAMKGSDAAMIDQLKGMMDGTQQCLQAINAEVTNRQGGASDNGPFQGIQRSTQSLPGSSSSIPSSIPTSSDSGSLGLPPGYVSPTGSSTPGNTIRTQDTATPAAPAGRRRANVVN